MQHHYLLIAGTISLLILSALCVYSPAHASSEVQNNFTVRAESGGNTAEDGEIVTGETKSSVDIKTTVDDEVVEEIHETSTDGYLRIESTVVSNDEKSFATTTVETQARTTQSVSGTNTFTDEPVVYTTSPSTIITLTETSNESSTEFESTEHTSFFARLFTRISTTFTYVLSNLFS